MRYNREGVVVFEAAPSSEVPPRMPSYSYPSTRSPLDGHQPADAGGDVQERLIPFPVPSRSSDEPEPFPRRRRETHDLERPNPARRTARRRQGRAPWLQRNALSIAAVSVLVALLGLGFGLLQMITRLETSPAAVPNAGPDLTAAVVGTTVALPAGSPAVPPTPSVEVKRDIQASAKVIEANYTVVAGDTLNGIASRFGTTPDRIQAFNKLADPRTLRIGTRLVIPPAL